MMEPENGKTNILYVISEHFAGRGEGTSQQVYLAHEKLFSEEDLIKFERRSHCYYQMNLAGITDPMEIIEQGWDLETLDQKADNKTHSLEDFAKWLAKERKFTYLDLENMDIRITGIVTYDFLELRPKF